MDDDKQQQLEEQFQALFAEGKAFPGRRPKIDNAIARLLINNQGFLAQSKFSSPRFEEGWFSFMNSFWSNLWEICPNSRTESAYCDSEVAINRFRFTLHRRIKGAEMKKTDLSLNAPIGGDGGYILLDQIAAPTQNNNYAELKQAVEEDITGEFSGTKMRSQPHINAQSCLLLYFELEDWMKVARQLGSDDISDFTSFVSSFNSFRTDKIEPLITKFWGLRELVDLDITGELQRTVMKDYPRINAQIVLYLTLQGTRTSYIAKKLDIKTALLTAFINDKCLPLLEGLSN